MIVLTSFSVNKPANIVKRYFVKLFTSKETTNIEEGIIYLSDIFESISDNGTLTIEFSELNIKEFYHFDNVDNTLFKRYINDGMNIGLNLSYKKGDKEFIFFVALYNVNYISIQILPKLGNVHDFDEQKAIEHDLYMKDLLNRFLSLNKNYSLMTRSTALVRV